MKRKNKKERDVLSYDDAPIEDYDKGEKFKINLSRKGKTVAVILIVCVLAVVIAAVWNQIAPNKIGTSLFGGGSGQGYPADIEGSNIQTGNIDVINGNLAYVSDTSFVVLNKSANPIVNRKLKFSKPTMAVNESHAVIYDLGGTGYRIDNVSETKYEGNTDGNILTADINSGGTYALVTEKSGYNSKLTVYNNDNTQKFAYYFADYYIDSVSLNESGNKAVLSGISSQNGAIISAVYVLEFTREEPVAKLEFNDNLICKVSFMNNGNIAAVGDSASYLINSNYQDKSEYLYDGKTLTSVAADRYNGFAIALSNSGDGRACDIRYISSEGSEKTIPANLTVLSMNLYGNSVGVLSKGGVLTMYNHNGEQTGAWDVGSDARAISLSSESYVYVLGVSELRAYKLPR